MVSGDTSPFGHGLRHWRRVRGLSQLELAGTAATTTRHLSFLETGRSRPSREMVERLVDALKIPLRERNRLLEMAGLAPAYPEGDLNTADLAPFQAVIGRLLASHDPYPGYVVDRQWNMIRSNHGAEAFLAGIEEHNTVRLVLGPLRPVINNWQQVTAAMLDRLGDDLLRFPGDPVLQQLHADITDALGPSRPEPSDRAASRVICPQFIRGETIVRTITVSARFESVTDITLNEIRVELIYPEDAQADQFFHDLVGKVP